MRSYLHNSPQAAARIVALSMIADGHLSQREVLALESLEIHRQLDLAPAGLHDVLQALCEDLLICANDCWSNVCRIDAGTLAQLLAEVGDPLLQSKVLELCVRTVEADGHITEGESRLVGAAAAAYWGAHGRG